MTKILVLGSGGMAGSMITKYLSLPKHQHDVIGWSRKDFDVLKDDIPDLNEYQYVVNCIGLIKQKSNDSNLLYKLNSEFPKKLSKKHNKIIHISSDCVFSGNIPPETSYYFTEFPDAEDDYGKSKAEGEKIDAMILRTSIIGPSKDNNGLFEWFKNTNENIIKGFYNHYWNGLTTLELAKQIEIIISEKQYRHDIVQIGSYFKISKLELLHFINSIFKLNKYIIPVFDKISINRSLCPDIIVSPIAIQLYELREFLNEEN